MGLFDDLVPTPRGATGAARNPFADLIPAAPARAAGAVAAPQEPAAPNFGAQADLPQIRPTPEAAPVVPFRSNPQRAPLTAAQQQRETMIEDMRARLSQPGLSLDERAVINRNIADLVLGQGEIADMAAPDEAFPAAPANAARPLGETRPQRRAGDPVAAATVEANPDGTALGRAVQRGALRTAASVPAALASADIAAVADVGADEGTIAAQAFFDAAGFWPSRGQDVSTTEKGLEILEDMGYPASIRTAYVQGAAARQRRASEMRANPDLTEAARTRAGENVGAFSGLMQRAQDLQFSPQGQRIQQEFAQSEDTLSATLGVIARNPLDFATWMTEVAAESAPSLAAGGAASLLTGGTGGAAALAATSMAQEYGPSVDEFLQDQGVDISDPAQAAALIDNPELMRAASGRGLARGAVIAAFETLGQGAVGRSFFNTPVGNAIVDTTIQAATGAGGEAAARAASGQGFSARETLIEGLAEGITAPIEVGMAVREGRAERRANEGRFSDGAAPLTPPAEDRERAGSTRLSEADRASPIRNDIIDDGRARLDSLIGPSARTSDPAASIAPLDTSLGRAPRDEGAPIRGGAPRAPSEPAPDDDVDIPEDAVPAELLLGRAAQDEPPARPQARPQQEVQDEEGAPSTRPVARADRPVPVGAARPEERPADQQGRDEEAPAAGGEGRGAGQQQPADAPARQAASPPGPDGERPASVEGVDAAPALVDGGPDLRGGKSAAPAPDAPRPGAAPTTRPAADIPEVEFTSIETAVMNGAVRQGGRETMLRGSEVVALRRAGLQATARFVPPETVAAIQAERTARATPSARVDEATTVSDAAPVGTAAPGTDRSSLPAPVAPNAGAGRSLPQRSEADEGGIFGEEPPVSKDQRQRTVTPKIAVRRIGGGMFDATIDGQPLGSFSLKLVGDEEAHVNVALMREEQQGKGYGQEVYDQIEKVSGRRLIPSPDQSAAAKRFWAKRQARATAPTARTKDQRAPASNPRTKTPEFRQWFGKSKIADDAGEPIRVFHGTRQNFDAFDAKAKGPQWPTVSIPGGLYFSSNPNSANAYAGGDHPSVAYRNEGANVVPTYLKVENPLTYEFDADEYFAPDQFLDSNRDRVVADLAAASESGDAKDGVIATRMEDGKPGTTAYVVFDPKQVKSTFNRGTFDPKSPRISEQRQRKAPARSTRTLAGFDASNERATSQPWQTGRDLKVAMQDATLAAAKSEGLDLRDESYLVDMATSDGKLALAQNPNAVGWYDIKTRQALAVMALVHPEVATDPEARLAFTWVMAVTSNGLKVGKNFEIAEAAYRAYKATGSMPLDMGIGTAKNAINFGMELYNTLIQQMGPAGLREFMLTERPVNEVERISGIEVSGESKKTMVRGAAILGPKIGNGFFSNLYGNFTALTMDRWLIRTWGRWTGTLIQLNDKQIGLSRERLRRAMADLDVAQVKAGLMAVKKAYPKTKTQPARLEVPERWAPRDGLIEMLENPGTTDEWFDELSRQIVKTTQQAPLRAPLPSELRLGGNALGKYLDGQKERPAGPKERQEIRRVFGAALENLRKGKGLRDLTMADLQAVLWYGEKRLYETAKDKGDGNSQDGYEDDEAPDYANAAVAVARSRGVPEATITAALKQEEDRGRTAGAGRGAGAVDGEAARARDQAPAGRGDRGAGTDDQGTSPLPGAPNVQGASGPDARLTAVAEAYARSIGLDLRRQSEFAEVDADRATRIAAAYEAMPHAPQDPAVAEAYQNLIEQTTAQYRALEAAGYRLFFLDPKNDIYEGNPWNAMRDLRANQSMGVFPTEAGFGSGATDLDVGDNPMLADTGIRWGFGSADGPKRRVLANDLFRAVHDAFGHGLEGAGFRARGEENAWQAHIRLFTGSAQGAITSETRGQNSWLNYGPHGETNRTAGIEDTVFADQKTGLMPSWTWEEGRVGDMEGAPASRAPRDQAPEETQRPALSDAVPATVDRLTAALPRLRLDLDRLGLKSVRLAIDRTIEAQGRFEVNAAGDMGIVIGASLDPNQTLGHEAIHALKEMDLFTPAEWRDLSRAAEADWMEQYDIVERYPDLTLEEQIEEAIAEAFGDYFARPAAEQRGMIGRAMNKIRALIDAMRSWLNTNGVSKPEDIFGRISSGRVGARATGQPRGADGKFVSSTADQAQTTQDAEVSAVAGQPLTSTVSPEMPMGARKQSFLTTMLTQPIDAAFRIPFMAIGGIDERGRWQYGKWTYDRISGAVTAGQLPKPMAFAQPLVDRIRAGMVDRYGLDPVYIDRERRRTIDEAKLSAKGMEHLETLKRAKIGAAESRILHAVLTGEAVPDAEMASISAPIIAAIDAMGAEAVDLGLISPESYERNRGQYLHRLYAKHELTPNAWGAAGKWMSKLATGRRQKIIGDQFKGRGIFTEATAGQVMANTPDMALARKRSARIKALETRRANLMRRYEVAAARLGERSAEQEAQIARRMDLGEKARPNPTPNQRGRAAEQGVALTRLTEKSRQAWRALQKLDNMIEAVDGAMMATEEAIFTQGDVKPQKGEKYVLLQKKTNDRDGKEINRRRYVPVDSFKAADHEGWNHSGELEVRGFKGGKVVLWRDFTKAERQSMGEIVDARYAIAKTYALMAHDLATGRFFNDIAKNPQWAVEEPPAGSKFNPEGGKNSRLYPDLELEWVFVPATKIAKSEAKQFGNLGGMYVRAEIWRDLQELEKLQTPDFWQGFVTQWKLNKTARSPVTHMNNVMSNMMLMDMADVRGTDLVAGVRSLATGDESYQEAVAAGAFGGDYVTQEIRENILQPMLEEMQKGDVGGRGPAETLLASYGPFGTVGKVGDLMAKAFNAVDRTMLSAYQMEDQAFRMALYIRRRRQGFSVDEAAKEALDQFLDYDIRAPWINAARRSVLPFIAYTYRAAPKVAQTFLERPWKIAKYATIYALLNGLAYSVAPSDDDEEDERKSLRRDQQGKTWLGVGRMIRMPWLSEENPVFLDVRRWIPAGDIIDIGSESTLPNWLSFGGPLALGAELYLNKSAFTGEEIYDPNLVDTLAGRTAANAGYLWRSWMPSAPWVPGSWYWEKIGRAAGGEALQWGTETPYSLSEALLSSIGIKVQPQDVQLGFTRHMLEYERDMRGVDAEQSRMQRDFGRGLISEEAFMRGIETLANRRQQYREDLEKVMPQ